jgi:CheY-like chemotaxis protein
VRCAPGFAAGSTFDAVSLETLEKLMQTHALAPSLAATRRRPLESYDYVPELALGHAHLRILIVNEDMRCADSLKRTLHDLGYFTTFTAYSARRALVAAADFSPAVVLLDLELPDMTGYQLADKLRSHLQGYVRRVPLLAIAERPMFGNLELTRAAGFIGCLSKPVLPIELNSMLHRLHR